MIRFHQTIPPRLVTAAVPPPHPPCQGAQRRPMWLVGRVRLAKSRTDCQSVHGAQRDRMPFRPTENLTPPLCLRKPPNPQSRGVTFFGTPAPHNKLLYKVICPATFHSSATEALTKTVENPRKMEFIVARTLPAKHSKPPPRPRFPHFPISYQFLIFVTIAKPFLHSKLRAD